MKKILQTLSLSALFVAGATYAQVTNIVVYKYHDGKGKASYSLVPPHGETNFQRFQVATSGYLNFLSEDESPSMLIPRKVEPVVRPKPIAQKEAKPKNPQEELVEGTISREQRCKDAQSDIATISERQTIYEEDRNGNLVPLTPEQAQQRLAKAQEIAAKVCQ